MKKNSYVLKTAKTILLVATWCNCWKQKQKSDIWKLKGKLCLLCFWLESCLYDQQHSDSQQGSLHERGKTRKVAWKKAQKNVLNTNSSQKGPHKISSFEGWKEKHSRAWKGHVCMEDLLIIDNIFWDILFWKQKKKRNILKKSTEIG